jgi:hypothetical protein
MKTAIIAAALAATMFTAGAASAQSVNQRQYNQQRRIDHGVASGRLTPGEAARVERQQASINRQEDRMRDRHGGYLTGRNRAVLQHRQDNASRHIRYAKHNGRRY